VLADPPSAPAVATYSFNGMDLRVVEIDGEPWFVAKDVCTVLEMDLWAGTQDVIVRWAARGGHTPWDNRAVQSALTEAYAGCTMATALRGSTI
jgi:prophage antirepressor-like protein